MAFIKIISLPGGNGASCSKYFYKDGPRENNKNWIGIGEIAEVPDADLDRHLASGKLSQASASEAAAYFGSLDQPKVEPARRGRPPKHVESDMDAIYSAQR